MSESYWPLRGIGRLASDWLVSLRAGTAAAAIVDFNFIINRYVLIKYVDQEYEHVDELTFELRDLSYI